MASSSCPAWSTLIVPAATISSTFVRSACIVTPSTTSGLEVQHNGSNCHRHWHKLPHTTHIRLPPAGAGAILGGGVEHGGEVRVVVEGSRGAGACTKRPARRV